MTPDADELVIFDGSQSVGDAFIFEPTTEEAKLGWLFAVAETSRKDLGREIIDNAIQTIQKEYYRDASRSITASFESALHQANLIMHDLAEKRMRDWMNSFHVSVGVLAKQTHNNISHTPQHNGDRMILHISTAGDGIVILARSRQISVISSGLSHSPIIDPLRTFSQVASGEILDRDILYFGTANFDQIFRQEDLARFVPDQTAETISTRLMQLYADQNKQLPTAALVITVTEQPTPISTRGRAAGESTTARLPLALSTGLLPRKPIQIHRSLLKNTMINTGRLAGVLYQQFRLVVWPVVKTGSLKGGRVLFLASRTATRNVQSLTAGKMKKLGVFPYGQPKPIVISSSTSFLPSIHTLRNLLRQLLQSTRQGVSTLPPSSKIFAILALILAASLGVSLVMLQTKRANDAQIQKASELLHEARTKKEAAETTLIYDNRDQARQLLSEAMTQAERVATQGFYAEQTQQLMTEITQTQDRIDRVYRLSTTAPKLVGDFTSVLSSNSKPTRLFYLNDALYSFDPANNTILRMTTDGAVKKASQTTQGIGFFVNGVAHIADKAILFVTNEPGLAMYDSKTELLQKQEVAFPAANSQVVSLATFGNRVYLYDQSTQNIYGYSKTLRGYSNGTPWLQDSDYPRDNITDIGVDGYIYSLHKDGSIRKLLKGAPVDFKIEPVSPAVGQDAHLLINENLRHIYVFDPINHRVVIYDTVGNLSRQVFFNQDFKPTDITVDPAETTLYLLSEAKISAVSLAEINN